MDNKMYLLVLSHWISGRWPEDDYDYGDEFIGVFETSYSAEAVMKALPMKGKECINDHARYPEKWYKVRDEDEQTTENYRYQVIPIIRF